jgi:hypothetical protein
MQMAISKAGMALSFVKKQTYELCELAVNEDRFAIRYVDKKCMSEEQYSHLRKICYSFY